MAEFTIAELLSATGGELLRKGGRQKICGISIDTRTMNTGEAYVAINGKSLDGHAFVKDAVKKGAQAVIVSRGKTGVPERTLAKHAVSVVRVADTTRALGDIAMLHRKRFDPIVIGITGSNGKSTTKEMLAAILSRKYDVLKPRSSFNNDIGVPLTVLALEARTEVVIAEMEMNILGGIRRLCEIARPGIGIITNIGDTHLESLHDRKGVAQEKSELIEFIDGNGTAVLNADDPLVMDIGRRFRTREVVSYGIEKRADLFATRVRDLGLAGAEFRLNGELPVKLPIPGVHNVYNALAAMASASALGIRVADVLQGIEQFKPLPLRLQVESVAGIRFIVDCYNANPQSMAAALELLARTGKGRRIIVLGDMLELGAAASDAHRALGQQAARVGQIVMSLGQFCQDVAEGARAAGLARKAVLCPPGVRAAADKLVDLAQPGDTILVKGSRANKMEEIVQELKGIYATRDKSRNH